ncbi:phosphoglucomutase (alpha-D-glucose-1,6-bisphosphate-dependent) [Colwellia sp. 1_MG-2023]|jgi:phosphoglucomutase|uniref:phosphoglucomutase (alpha-D-glucose-1,6-bisphosphate-dependent) n=1 Tax=unclassified Colwellia TaxID=196834 RepID=UPI001C0A3DEB|nr:MULTISPECIES: phosphoglucomutase (alpha-D-glucose-1,6-bisphosphate-dependent) [unclassified Colwellia]MBU2925707.1 phosphoglucomutase (alpha-D-glucose-1,6-bisphosphate-dependent) [Colwellia sp. C2M11]MDO6651067.1 phosphoglucomutase (alpha-D-glucose-1,6-bisphosphate-dependent) [Colwellia sp. 3_MG-2023]MDO6664102.1 phosphoglucomutase (alpha-D-glucose-1,6-bisphosphate-dependent) [Colwellia sp. 2_MG-2023]MDO6688453.1 phosphoglucomutase (alpha-D-glucose-1,6-bisphosphate-dependent) [Colwellia sp. 
MSVHPHAGKPVRPEDRINIGQLVSDYFLQVPDVAITAQRVSFGTSGHRGSSAKVSFNEAHILAICQAVVEYRHEQKITGPLFLGKDTHALSEPAFASTIAVLIANGVNVVIQNDSLSGAGFTPTPVISRLIISHNKIENQSDLADGLIITPSHNPPTDGGIKYNPPHGGPAEGEITKQIEQRANALIKAGLVDVKQVSFAQAVQSPLLSQQDFIEHYVSQLNQVIDMEAIAKAGVTIGVDPLGGSGIAYWPVIAKKYGLNIKVVNPVVDASFAFMPLDKDGKIRMDCSSPYAMAGLIAMKDDFDISVGNDPDFDRHGIVTKFGGLMNPNHYLAVAINYLMTHRNWSADCKIGKTLVSSSLINRVAKKIARPLSEVPVGFKWFVDGLHDSSYAFGGEESAGATFLARDGSTWTTDKDGFIMALLAAEILAVTGKDPHQHYLELAKELGEPCYGRVEAVATFEQKKVLTALSSSDITADVLAGEKITEILSHAPGNNAAIGGIKVVTENGWFAARPSGTEEIYKIYAESFIDEAHLQTIIKEAQDIVSAAFQAAGL